MKVIALANQKGGVAKTTSALSLGASFARLGHQTLLIDLDPQANLTLGVGLEPEAAGLTTFDLLVGTHSPDAVIQQTRWEGLAIMPADLTLAGAERRLYGELGFDEILSGVLRRLRNRFDVVLIDCPPSLGLLTLNALGAADTVLVPVQCEFFSARGLGQLMEIIRLVRRRRNPGLRLRILPTLYDPRNRICQRVREELVERFPEACYQTSIGLDTRIRDSHAAGVPLPYYSSRSRAATQYAQLAGEVIGDAERGIRAA